MVGSEIGRNRIGGIFDAANTICGDDFIENVTDPQTDRRTDAMSLFPLCVNEIKKHIIVQRKKEKKSESESESESERESENKLVSPKTL